MAATPTTLSISAVFSGSRRGGRCSSGRLTPAESAVIKTHPEHTLNVLRHVPTAEELAIDALMSARPYRAAMPLDQGLALIQQGRATEFCLDCVDVLGPALAAAAT